MGLVNINGELEGKTTAQQYVDEKLGFIYDIVGNKPEIFVDKVKGGDLVNVTLRVRVQGKDVVITTENHRAFTKCIDELVDTSKTVINKNKNKSISKKRRDSIRAKEEMKKEQWDEVLEEMGLKGLEKKYGDAFLKEYDVEYGEEEEFKVEDFEGNE